MSTLLLVVLEAYSDGFLVVLEAKKYSQIRA